MREKRVKMNIFLLFFILLSDKLSQCHQLMYGFLKENSIKLEKFKTSNSKIHAGQNVSMVKGNTKRNVTFTSNKYPQIFYVDHGGGVSTKGGTRFLRSL